MYGISFQIEALLSLKNAWLSQIFVFGYQEHLLQTNCKFYFLTHSFKLRKNMPVLIGTTHRKPTYLETSRIYAQQQKLVGTVLNLLSNLIGSLWGL